MDLICSSTPTPSGSRAWRKCATAAIRPAAANDWVKKTCAQRETLRIAGFALKANKFDGIYLDRQKGNDLVVYAGKVDHGFDKSSPPSCRRA
jgi:bifunctional non-homologous end joining protein LigD